MTKDPNAKTASGGQDHSSKARAMLKDYYLGKLNEVIGDSIKVNTSSTSGAPASSQTTTNTPTNNTSVKSETVSNPSVVPASNITLSLSEISKHNKQSDCFLLISGKVYDITSFFGSHPGGNSVMAATCGTDATVAYMTKDPNATSSGSRSAHSSGATGMLESYYIGNLNQSVGSDKITATNSVSISTTNGNYREWDD